MLVFFPRPVGLSPLWCYSCAVTWNQILALQTMQVTYSRAAIVAWTLVGACRKFVAITAPFGSISPKADIGKSEYSWLNQSSQNWDCFRCCSRNSSTIPYSYNVEVSNNLSALEGLSEDCVFSPPTNYPTHTTRHSSSTTPIHTFPSMGSTVSSIHTD